MSSDAPLRIPHSALFSGDPAAKAIRGIVVRGLDAARVAALLKAGPESARLGDSTLQLVQLVVSDDAAESRRFAPLASTLLRVLGSDAPLDSSRFSAAVSCLRAVVVAHKETPSFSPEIAQSVLVESPAVASRLCGALRSACADADQPLDSSGDLGAACATVCDAIAAACNSLNGRGGAESDANLLGCAVGLIPLFGVDNDVVSAGVSRALAACTQALFDGRHRGRARDNDDVAGTLLASLTAAPGHAHRGVLRELAAAALQMPTAGGTSSPQEAQAASDGATARLVTVLGLCDSLTSWLGGGWLVASGAGGSFFRALVGCVASEAKVRLEDIEFWLVLIDVPAAAPAVEPSSGGSQGAGAATTPDGGASAGKGKGLAYGPNDASAAMAAVQARLAATPRRRRLEAAVAAYAGHAAVLRCCWRVLSACVRELATLADDDAPGGAASQPLKGAAALPPEDLLALRGTLQDAASFSLMAATSLWQSDLRAELCASGPADEPRRVAPSSGAGGATPPDRLATAVADPEVASLELRFQAAAPVVAGASRYALAYLREDPGACEAEWDAALPCLARLGAALDAPAPPAAWEASVRHLLQLSDSPLPEAAPPTTQPGAGAHADGPSRLPCGGVAGLLAHPLLDVLGVLELKLEAWSEGAPQATQPPPPLAELCALPEAPLLVARALAWLQRCARAFSLAAMAAEAFVSDAAPARWMVSGGGADDDAGSDLAAEEALRSSPASASEVADAVAPQLADAVAAALGVCVVVSQLLKAPAVRQGLPQAAAAGVAAVDARGWEALAGAAVDLAAFATRLVRCYSQPSTPLQRHWAAQRSARAAATKCAKKLVGVASELAVALKGVGLLLPPQRPGVPGPEAAVAAAYEVVFRGATRQA